ncbi:MULTISPECIES: AAA family ATPase [Streptomyces]|uniref:Tetratricopeptide (TPR) repeat protein n=2 Tax=Streptomyces stelliscabiei TaxID=146820 RepID=A0A8I0P3N9_9ACTN|nr:MULTISPECIES: AAA family ATPase [Streptomyces]KND43358.1 CbxX/CfqX [Streptomyces stelliscabiei]MBE1595651.1 tetratricopeptide (TPR) repeat protein [Streptomyces stelliscabiei]MDX2517665.1 AAA family ATPase [Streptomyces stelliscabiei]MDX2555479.1 AAA family ATPase [Streptomyces stelliscabiei]MDX2613997.1 AAA family ATPase [Streptomyces stelliscabiei]
MDFGSRGPEAPADLAWLRGVDAYTMGAYPQAEEEFRAAVRMDPGMADGWLGLHALRVDTTTALLRMFRHRERFGEQRSRHRRTLNSWYWLGWWVQPVLESPRDLLLAHASHWLDGRHVPELDRALAGLPPVDADHQVRFLHACRAYLVKDWEQLVRHTDPLLDDALLGIEAGLFGGMARVRLETYGQAEPLLSAALMRCRSEQPQRKELRYWLARAHEGTGRSAAALPLYRAVHRVDPAFMDTSARLAAIAEGDGYDDEASDFAAIALAGIGQDILDGDGLEPFFDPEGRDLKVSDPGLPPPGGLPPEAGDTFVREKSVVPVQPVSLPAGPTDPELLEEALAELERMVGLEPVKRQVKALSAQLNMARLRAGQGLPVQPPKRHFVFSGPSGTGKTTVARILGRVFYALGLLGGDHLVEAQRADLVGEYLGQTAVKANELIDSAIGGVLFVDEAYSLSNSGYGKGDAYGDEALQVLLKRAEDNRDHLVVILAGYPEGMDRLLAANPGLSSRFTTRVDFPSYRPLELTSIGEVLAAENGDVWDEEALDELRSVSGHVVDQGWIDELGNGRFLRTLYEKSCAYRDLRLSGYPTIPTRDDLSTLRLPDLMQAYGEVLSGRGPGEASAM